MNEQDNFTDIENKIENIEKSEKPETDKKKSKGDFWLKVISVIVAVLIWFWVIGFESQVTRKKFVSIPVNMDYLTELKSNYGYSLIGEKELYIDVTLEGKSSYLNKIKTSDIYAYIDLRTVSQPGEIPVSIEIKEMDNVRITEQSQSSTILYIGTESFTNIPVRTSIVQMVKGSDIDIGELELSTRYITVYGVAEILKTLDYALVNLSLGNIERSMTVTEKFVLIDKNGEEVKNQYITTREVTTIDVKVPVTMKKEVPVKANYKYGYYNSRNTEITVIPDKIQISGPPDYIASIDEVLLEEIDEKKHENDIIITTPILPLPEGVTITSGITSVDVEIKFIDRDTKFLNISTIRANPNFSVIPPANFEYHIKEERVEIKLLGPASAIKYIGSSGVSATVDMSSLTEKGAYVVPLNISVTSSNSNGSVFCVGDYSVSVEIY